MTDKQKAEYYDEWETYFEPLARIYREARRAAHKWPEREGDDLVNTLIIQDAEVSEEVKNLIRMMLEEIENE